MQFPSKAAPLDQRGVMRPAQAPAGLLAEPPQAPSLSRLPLAVVASSEPRTNRSREGREGGHSPHQQLVQGLPEPWVHLSQL